MSTATTGSPVTARIVFWGAEGAGKTTSLHAIHSKLKADHRGDLRSVPTRLDPTVTYETFPIQLGSIGGSPTHLRVIAVPGAPALAHTRKQLLDEVDGLVLVLDAQSERLDDNLAALSELRDSLAAYGRVLEEIPVVVQYNKRDLGDPFAIEALHRRLALPEAAVFETVATDSTGVLQALTTISKRVVRVLRERSGATDAGTRAAPSAPTPPVEAAPAPACESEPLASIEPIAEPDPVSAREAMESAILAEGDASEVGDASLRATQVALDDAWPEVPNDLKADTGARIGTDMKIVSVGSATRSGERGVRVPLVLGNDAGESVTVELNISLEPMLDDGST